MQEYRYLNYWEEVQFPKKADQDIHRLLGFISILSEELHQSPMQCIVHRYFLSILCDIMKLFKFKFSKPYITHVIIL